MGPFHKDSGIDLVKASPSISHHDSSTTNIPSTAYTQNNTTHSPSETEDQTPTAPPPAYHTIVHPDMPIPNISSPYDPLPHSPTDPNPHDTDDDTPEITINAATQIRGHGNIISIAQMDSIRIANLISSVLSSADSTSPVSPKPEENEDNTTPPTPTSPSPTTTASRQYTSTTRVRGIKRYPNINITVHCGATIIGDRNIVGPGLGDIARQMQIAQRNQAAMVAQQRAAAAAAAATTTSQGYAVGQGQCQQQQQQGNGGQGQGQMGVVTPPMSRSCSLDGGVGERKRKGVEGVESGAQRRRC